MSNKLTDHHIVSLYKEGANEQPNAVLDKQILELALQAVKNQAVSTTLTTIKKPRFYQTWYGQLSTAASFMLVTVLFVTNQQSLNETENQPQFHAESESISNDMSKYDPSLMSESEEIYDTKDAQNAKAMLIKAKTKKLDVNKNAQEKQKVAASQMSLMVPIDEIKLNVVFKQVEALLNKGDTQQANDLIDELVFSFPSLEADIKSRYQRLLTEINDK